MRALVLPVEPNDLAHSSLGDCPCGIHLGSQPTVDCALGQRLVDRAWPLLFVLLVEAEELSTWKVAPITMAQGRMSNIAGFIVVEGKWQW